MWSVNSTICNRYHLLVSQILDDTVNQDFEFDENKAINYPYWNTQKKKKKGKNILSFSCTTQKAIHSTDSEHKT